MPIAGRAGRRRRQRGFTLIEMLVVISILGILAAIVTLSLSGLTSLARQRAQDGELTTVRDALTGMAMDQQIDPADACKGSPTTNDMSQFPSGTAWTASGTGAPVSLYPHYLRQQYLSRAYVCTSDGTVEPAGG